MNGVVIVDKPAGMTSHDVVAGVKKILAVRKAGHTGTLDPLATGVLPICLNEATKLAPFLSCEAKMYRATMLLGVETETLDIDGKIIAERTPDVAVENIRKVLMRFVGSFDQKPPGYSAVKYRGRALYHWTRKGVIVNPPSRKVEVYSLDLEDVSLPRVTFTLSCSAGTYVRSICAEAGAALGCGACLADLRRLRSGAFHLDGAAPLDDEQALKSRIMTMGEAVSHLPSFTVEEQWVKKLRNGVQPEGDIFQGHDISFLVAGDMITFVSDEGRLVAVAAIDRLEERCHRVEEDAPVVRILRIFHDEIT